MIHDGNQAGHDEEVSDTSMEHQSWDIDGKEDESCRSVRDSGSQEGSLASELMATDWGSWPLFIQFCVTVHINGQMDSFPVESIPNCLKDIIERCGQTMVDPAQELDADGKNSQRRIHYKRRINRVEILFSPSIGRGECRDVCADLATPFPVPFPRGRSPIPSQGVVRRRCQPFDTGRGRANRFLSRV